MVRVVVTSFLLLLLNAGTAWADGLPARSATRDLVAAPTSAQSARFTRCGCADLLPRRYWYQCYFRSRATADRVSLATAAALAAGSAAVLASGNRELILDSSDITQFLTPGLGLAVPLAHRDLRTSAQAALTIGLAAGLTVVGKETVEKQRPPLDGGSSYPSGHTAPAFAAAAFLYERYGPRYGIPAYVLAIHTGAARVVGSKHYLDDVIAGAGIGMLSAGLFEELFNGRCKPRTSWCWRPTWRYEFGFGAFWQNENVVRAPANGGAAFDLAQVGDWTEARASARLTVEWFPNARDEVAFRIDPAAIRTRTVAPFPITFDGSTYAAGAPLIARWRGNEYRLRWRREVLPCHPHLGVQAGASVVFVENGVSLESGATRSSVSALRVAPCPHLTVSYELLPRLTLSLLGEGVPTVSFFGFDLEAAVRYRITPRWDAGIVYRWWTRPLDDARLVDDAITQALFVTIGRSF